MAVILEVASRKFGQRPLSPDGMHVRNSQTVLHGSTMQMAGCEDSDCWEFDEETFWRSGDEQPLSRLLEYVGPGSRIVFEYQPTASFGGLVNSVTVAPMVGLARFTKEHEVLAGVYFISRDKKCLLDFPELTCLINLLEAWVIGCKEWRPEHDERPVLKRLRYETRNGLVVEGSASRRDGIVALCVASPVVIGLNRKELARLLQELQRLKDFLEERRGA